MPAPSLRFLARERYTRTRLVADVVDTQTDHILFKGEKASDAQRKASVLNELDEAGRFEGKWNSILTLTYKETDAKPHP